MGRRFSRRQLLDALAAIGGVALLRMWGSSSSKATAQELDEFIYLPTIIKSAEELPTPPPTVEPPANLSGKVVHVHSQEATSWNGQPDYWGYVDQAVINDMVDEGLKILTGADTVADAWRILLPSYQQGQGIAIKVNFNNSYQCNDTDNQIDALIQPVNAIVRGLTQIGVAEGDIWIYETRRAIPDRFVAGGQYQGVQYFARWCRNLAGFTSSDPDANVTFSFPPGTEAPQIRVTDVVVNATYLINIPIMKTHRATDVSLSFKNHFGTIDQPADLHPFIGLHESTYRSDHSPFVDLYQNPHIGAKTILTVGDGLFAATESNTAAPSLWTTFNNQVPNSLFFATDPVAVDCVMGDLLAAEVALRPEADDYLRLAGEAGLGIFERGDPWGSGYNQIDYSKIDL